jgi:hypothetical protein
MRGKRMSVSKDCGGGRQANEPADHREKLLLVVQVVVVQVARGWHVTLKFRSVEG